MGGYNLDIFHNQSERPYRGEVNLAHLLVGSEGTLAYTRNLTLRLSPLPRHRVLGVEAIVIADGTSCRQQIVDGAQRESIHLAWLLDRLLPQADAANSYPAERIV